MATLVAVRQNRIMFVRTVLLALLLASPATASSQEFKLLLLNSENGQPIPRQTVELEVWDASSSATILATRTDSEGVVRFTIDRSIDVETANLCPNLHDLGVQSCDASSASMLQIVRDGFNSSICGRAHTVAKEAPQPGVLVLYVYRLNLWERFKRMLLGDC